MMMRLDIAREFSPVPIGRSKDDGKRSAANFREDVLLPKIERAIKNGEILEVDFSGIAGIDPSFMDEAFGGLVRVHNLSSDNVLKSLRFVSKHPYFDPLFDNLRKIIKDEGNR